MYAHIGIAPGTKFLHRRQAGRTQRVKDGREHPFVGLYFSFLPPFVHTDARSFGCLVGGLQFDCFSLAPWLPQAQRSTGETGKGMCMLSLSLTPSLCLFQSGSLSVSVSLVSHAQCHSLSLLRSRRCLREALVSLCACMSFFPACPHASDDTHTHTHTHTLSHKQEHTRGNQKDEREDFHFWSFLFSRERGKEFLPTHSFIHSFILTAPLHFFKGGPAL
mmetsp:Transcript_14415/g.29006  ORF Transcript_14415/g.29006 Transcript_14415/m.29006 type:complete len:219 (+) Transcript_14415:352-1008(+)